ncbi:MAG TPA: PadR family transcriptional regulator [Solirubrobacteraceae bacterium]|jgi:DNA-binding PadR family transcriptional regulator
METQTGTSTPDEAAPIAAAGLGADGPGTSDPLLGDMRRAGLLPLLVLHYVAREPCYGNQLIDRIAWLTAGTVAVNPNTMYPLLRSLEARGLVAGEWESPGRRGRRYYRITPLGEDERRRLAGRLGPHLDAVAASVEVIRSELLEH